MILTTNIIYWVLQMDTIIRGLLVASVVLIIGGAGATAAITTYLQEEKKTSKGLWFSILPLSGVIFALLTAFIPSTKTLCAMYAIPKITQQISIDNTLKTVSKDVQEIYKIGIDTIKNLHKEDKHG